MPGSLPNAGPGTGIGGFTDEKVWYIMKFAVVLAGLCTTMSVAAPAHAAPAPPVAGDDAGFLAALRQDGISYASPDEAVTAGKAACTCLNDGESGLRLVHDVKIHNPGFDMESASQFAVIAAKYYCPQQLSKS